MTRYKLYGDKFLSHHGILGQKWGQVNGPPYPLNPEDHSLREKREGWKKSLGGKRNDDLYDRYDKKKDSDKTAEKKSEKDSRITKTLKKNYGLTDAQIAQYKKAAIALGVSLAATAGVLAVSYYVKNQSSKSLTLDLANQLNNDFQLNSDHFQDLVNEGQVAVHETTGYDKRASFGLSHTSLIEDINKHQMRADLIGSRARLNGYDAMLSGSQLLNNAKDITNYTNLHKDVLVNQRYNSPFLLDRRLSCWSGSHSYLLSMLTGKQYCARNYQNLVEFNDFGKLYNNKMNIVDLFGNKANDFVGNFGKTNGSKIEREDAKKLIETIYKNFNTPNAKNGSIVGFIDAAYRSTSCTHQWNFEINKNGIMSMVDSWSGEKYEVARKLSNGKVLLNKSNVFGDKGNGDSFLSELYHYNRESFRMYSPKFEDLNIDALADVILAKVK